MLTVVRLVALVSTGLLAGIYTGHRLGIQYAVGAVDDSSFVQVQQVIHVHYVRFMPGLVASAVLSAFIWLALVRRSWRTSEFALVALSAGAMLVVALATRVVNVPLNAELMTWTDGNIPTNLVEVWAPWDRVNSLRSVLTTGALSLEAFAIVQRAGGRT